MPFHGNVANWIQTQASDLSNTASDIYDATKNIAGNVVEGAKNVGSSIYEAGSDLYEAGSDYFSGDTINNEEKVNEALGQGELDENGNKVNLLSMTNEVQNGNFKSGLDVDDEIVSGDANEFKKISKDYSSFIPQAVAPTDTSSSNNGGLLSATKIDIPERELLGDKYTNPYKKEREDITINEANEWYKNEYPESKQRKLDEAAHKPNWDEGEPLWATEMKEKQTVETSQEANLKSEEILNKRKLAKKQKAGNFMEQFAEEMKKASDQKDPYQYSAERIFGGDGINY